MSKKGYISRYLLIIKKLKAKPYSSYEELRFHIEKHLEDMQWIDDSLDIGFSKRTLQRDLREIRNLFGITITYSRAEKGYSIQQDEAERMNFERMIESFDLFQSLHQAKDLISYVNLEKREAQGTENMYGLIHAIKNRLKIKFQYDKFWDDEITDRYAIPLALKEFKSRWYLIAKEHTSPVRKTFALDRIVFLAITNENFSYPSDYDVEEAFKHCFGIIGSSEEKPEEIILSFDGDQKNYIKTLPLHHSQRIISDEDSELRISLKVFITHDFIMELLSFGHHMTVIQPTTLAQQLSEEHKLAWERQK
jgi:predicted DNA-binding transcriptional regulator YafY